MTLPTYTFKIGPEVLWFVGTTIVGTFLVELTANLVGVEGWPALDTAQAWFAASSFAAVRAGLGALLALLGAGGFQTK